MTDVINEKRLIWYGHLRSMEDARFIKIRKQPGDRKKKNKTEKTMDGFVMKSMNERKSTEV